MRMDGRFTCTYGTDVLHVLFDHFLVHAITSVAAAPRSTNSPRSLSLLQKVVHEHAVVPAHSPHAPLQPPPHALDKHATHVECWTQSRLPPASERCNDSRLITVAKFQPASESSLRRQDDLTRALSLAGGPC